MVENGVREEAAHLKEEIANLKGAIGWHTNWMAKAEEEMEAQVREHARTKKFQTERMKEGKERLKKLEERLKELMK